jgi:replicative DNA helicase
VADALQPRAASNEETRSIIDSLGSLALDMAPVETVLGLVRASELVERVGINQILSPRLARGVPFPRPWLNEVTCGMLPGELWVLAGHTSSGKSSVAIQTRGPRRAGAI